MAIFWGHDMTEAEWLACQDPASLLQNARHRISERHLLLFSLACRLASPRGPIGILPEDCGYVAIDREERCTWDGWRLAVGWAGTGGDVPGEISIPRRAALLRDIVPPTDQRLRCNDCVGTGRFPMTVRPPAGKPCPSCAGRGTVRWPWLGGGETPAPVWYVEMVYGCTIPHLAHSAYGDRLPDDTLAPHRLAVLSDALEEAGCQEETLLRHLRGQERCPKCHPWRAFLVEQRRVVNDDVPACWPCKSTGWIPLRGSHVRGCWAVDLVLGKE